LTRARDYKLPADDKPIFEIQVFDGMMLFGYGDRRIAKPGTLHPGPMDGRGRAGPPISPAQSALSNVTGPKSEFAGMEGPGWRTYDDPSIEGPRSVAHEEEKTSVAE